MKDTSTNHLIKEATGITVKPIAVVGYSGHSYVIIDILMGMGRPVTAYCDAEEKSRNPYFLEYLGKESEAIETLKGFDFFVAIGDNLIRERVHRQLQQQIGNPVNAIHTSAVVAQTVEMGHGIMIAANATINPQVKLGHGVICNTASIIEHECIVGDFAHIAPGAVLCGNVKIGAGSFVGANTVIKPGITVGEHVIIGAGTVVIRDIPDHSCVAGNPQRILQKER